MIIAVVLVMISWLRAINPTLNIMSQCTLLQQELDSSKGGDQELQFVKIELAQINQMIGSEKLSTDEINRGIVDFISKKSSKLGIILNEFPSVHHQIVNEYSIYTYQAIIQGSFKHLLQLIYDMEYEYTGAHICAIRFYTVEEFRTKIKKLYSVIYIQNIKKNA